MADTVGAFPGALSLSPLSLLVRPFYSFHPVTVPLVSRRNYRRELAYALLFSTALAVVEGGMIGVVVRNAYDGVVPDVRLNLIVGVLLAAPEFANLSSFLWTALAHGRPKVAFINALQVAAVVLVGLIAAMPLTPGGLYGTAGAVVAARVCISGVVTLRATLWRANYARKERARATGKFSTVSVLVMAGTGVLLGQAMDWSEQSFRVIVPIACVLGLIGAGFYGRIRVRGHRGMVRAEREKAAHERPSLNPAALVRLLIEDRAYAHFMASMFLLGAGNLMLSAPLVISLKERFGEGYGGGIRVMNTIPLLVMPCFIPLWARLLSRVHVVRFRSIHSWVFVAAQGLVLVAVLWRAYWVLYLASALQGVALAGGTLAWNLGHLDFAPSHKSAQYMAVHVTLNGVRGVLAPLAAVLVYESLEGWRVGAGAWVFGVSVVLCVLGGLGFMSLARTMGPRAREE